MADRFAASFLRTSDGEVWGTNTEKENNVRAALVGSSSALGAIYYGYIDLSDTTNWPHVFTGRIDLSFLTMLVDKGTNGRGQIGIGVLTRVGVTDSDIYFVAGLPFTENDSSSVELSYNFSPSQIKTNIESGHLARVKTNSVILNEPLITTATALPFGTGGPTFTPAVGDLVLRINNTGGSFTWTSSVIYHSHPA